MKARQLARSGIVRQRAESFAATSDARVARIAGGGADGGRMRSTSHLQRPTVGPTIRVPRSTIKVSVVNDLPTTGI